MLTIGRETNNKIQSLKNDLNKSFARKDLGLAKQISGMRVTCDKKDVKLW